MGHTFLRARFICWYLVRFKRASASAVVRGAGVLCRDWSAELACSLQHIIDSPGKLPRDQLMRNRHGGCTARIAGRLVEPRRARGVKGVVRGCALGAWLGHHAANTCAGTPAETGAGPGRHARKGGRFVAASDSLVLINCCLPNADSAMRVATRGDLPCSRQDGPFSLLTSLEDDTQVMACNQSAPGPSQRGAGRHVQILTQSRVTVEANSNSAIRRPVAESAVLATALALPLCWYRIASDICVRLRREPHRREPDPPETRTTPGRRRCRRR